MEVASWWLCWQVRVVVLAEMMLKLWCCLQIQIRWCSALWWYGYLVMDIISGEYSSVFLRYSGIDIRVSLLFRFTSCCVTVFYFFFVGSPPVFFSFFIHFFCSFILEGENERDWRDNDIKFGESFSLFLGGMLNHVGVTILGFLESP